MAFELPDLPYAFDALEPHIDAQTMEIHHDRHHKAYVDNANAALAGTELEGKSVEYVLDNLDNLPEDKRTASLWETLARIQLTGGKPKDAEESFKRALGIEGTSASHWGPMRDFAQAI